MIKTSIVSKQLGLMTYVKLGTLQGFCVVCVLKWILFPVARLVKIYTNMLHLDALAVQVARVN